MNQKTTILFDMYGVILEESKGNFNSYLPKQETEKSHQILFLLYWVMITRNII